MVFEEPYEFRCDRKPNRHVAFGYGAHLCLGQYLAKLEMRILFEELLPRLKSITLDGEVKMTQAYFVNGPKKLPIRPLVLPAERFILDPASEVQTFAIISTR